MSSAQLKKFSTVKPAQIEWRNGLPFNTEFDDVYFSIHGAIEESQHVFIEGNQLVTDWNQQQKRFYITELGFGSGLNFFNTAKHWVHTATHNNQNKHKHLHYVAIEKRPFSLDDFTKTCRLWPSLSDFSDELIRYYPSQTYGKHQIYFKKWHLTLTLMLMPLEDAFDDLIKESEAQQNKIEIDHWFLDGFSPTKNNSMWGEHNAKKIAQLSKIGTRLATYSVAGSVKRPLLGVGFKITKKKGFAKKREMLTAVLTQTCIENNRSKFINLKHETPWFNLSINKINRTLPEEKIAIIGGGIAGCATAYTLSQKGFLCDLFESKEGVGLGASGAAAGIFHPQLTNDMNIGSQFNWLAYLALLRFLSDFNEKKTSEIILITGIERFLKNEKLSNQLIELANTIGISKWIKKSNQFKNNCCVSFPHAAAINISAFCQLLLNEITNSSLSFFPNYDIQSIHYEDERWILSTQSSQHSYKQVVFCGGAKSSLLRNLNITSTNTTRGQTCYFNSEKLAKELKRTLCEKIYLVPQGHNQFQLGSTFESFEDDQLNVDSQNDMLNRASIFLNNVGLPYLSPSEIQTTKLNGTLGYRLHSLDRMPIVGGVINQSKLIDEFYQVGQSRLLRQSISHYNLPGLWVNTAYGSHGLLYSILASQHLASLVSNDISPLQNKMSNAVHPARFIIKELKSALNFKQF